MRLIPRAPVLLIAALLLPGSSPGGYLAAQDVATDSPDAASAADTTPPVPLPALVVTATRVPVPADVLPFAVSVRYAGVAVAGAGLSLAENVAAVPGLQVQSRYNEALGDRIVMRGFGARAQFGVRGIHVLVDGIPATMPDGQTTLNHLDLSLLERVEVLRGPAAASHGNAAGGVLLLTTRPPPVKARQEVAGAVGGQGLARIRVTSGGSAGGRPGGDDRGGGGGASSGGATGWLASVSREGRDGFRPHSDTDRLQATGRFDTPLAGGFLRVVGHGVSYDAENPGALTREQYAEDSGQAQPFNVAQGTGEAGRHGQLGATWESALSASGSGEGALARALEGARLEAGAYGIVRSLENPIPPSVIDLDRRAAGARVLLRSGSWGLEGVGARERGREVRPWSWAVGADAAFLRDDRQNFENAAGDRGALTLDQVEGVSNVAAHGQALVPLPGRLDLYLAGRYDRIRFSADDRFVTAGNPDDSGDRTMDAFSPTAGIRLAIAAGAQLFGNVSTAFQTPTTTELVNRPDGAGGFNPELEPQRTLSYELGGRAAVSRALSLEATVYHARVRDALVPFEVPTAPGRQFFRNAGEAVHEGVELAARLATRPVDVLASYARTDARFTAFATDDASYTGNEVPGVWPWVAEAVVVARPPWPAPGLSVQLDWRATGEMAADNANEAWADGHQLLGARVSGRGLRLGQFDLSAYAGVDNILDRSYVGSVVPNAFGGRFFEPGPGRTLYVGLELARSRK